MTSTSGSLRGRIIAAATLSAAAVVVVAGTWLAPERGSAATGGPRIEPVDSAVLVCPDSSGTKDVGVRVSAAVVPDQPGQDRPGAATLRSLPGANPLTATIDASGGQAQVVSGALPHPPVVVRARGGLAPGLVADQTARGRSGAGWGRASAACVAPAAEWWFVGGGGGAGRRTRLVLTNPESTPAQVDVTVYAGDGPVDTPGGQGVAVPAAGRTVLRVDALAPENFTTAIHVQGRIGRVAAALSDSEVAGLAARGVDWVPPAATPARSGLVPGVPSGVGPRELLVLNPSERAAEVSIRLITPDATFAPAGVDRLEVPAGAVATVELTEALAEQPAAVVFSSDVPVTAGVRSRIPGPDRRVEQSWTAAAGALTGPGAVSGLPVSARTETALLLTAPRAAGRVTVDLLPYAEPGAPARPVRRLPAISVPAGRTVQVPLPGVTDAPWFTAVVTPDLDLGPVYAAHVTAEDAGAGVLFTGYPMALLRVTVGVPAVQPDLAVTVGR